MRYIDIIAFLGPADLWKLKMAAQLYKRGQVQNLGAIDKTTDRAQ